MSNPNDLIAYLVQQQKTMADGFDAALQDVKRHYEAKLADARADLRHATPAPLPADPLQCDGAFRRVWICRECGDGFPEHATGCSLRASIENEGGAPD